MKNDKRDLKREYKQMQKDMGVIALRSLKDDSLILLPSTDVKGFINRYDFTKKMNTPLSLPVEFRKMVERDGFDGVVLEILELIENKPEQTEDERKEELELLYEIIQEKFQSQAGNHTSA